MQEFHLLEFGAVGDGLHDDTLAIQNAINQVKQAGSGRVVFDEKGIYRSGKVVLCDNLELYFQKGSLWIAENNIDAFGDNALESMNLVEQPTWEKCDYSGMPEKYFIYAKNCKNIVIDGEGRIDGNEEIFYGKETKWHIDGYFYPRVPLIFFENCENIKIKNVVLQRSAFWTIHLVGCNEVDIENVQIYNNLKLANSDGIDPDHCKNVRIKNCYIESADDCIVFKTTSAARQYGSCENISVENCTLMSTSAAIKFGTESVSDIKNISISNCKIIHSNRGISFQLRDEGNISNVTFKNISIETRRFSPIHWWGKAEPIAITAVRRKKDSVVGKIEHIKFEGIQMDSENGIFIYGSENQNISNLEFQDMELFLQRKTDWDIDTYDVRPCEELGILKCGLYYRYICNAKNIKFTNCKEDLDSSLISDFTKPFYTKNTKNVVLKEGK